MKDETKEILMMALGALCIPIFAAYLYVSLGLSFYESTGIPPPLLPWPAQ